MIKGLKTVGLIAAAGLAISSTAAFADELALCRGVELTRKANP